jgi:uncharacterized membrane protein
MATDTGKSALGLDGNVAAALGYPIGIIAIISLIMEKENRFVKFHALQALLLYALVIVLWFAVVIITVILGIIGFAATSAAGETGSALGGLIGVLWWLIVMVIFVGAFVGMIMAAVKAYQGNLFKLPIIGGMADKWVK